ncbi:uncharacterized protein LOC122650762 [Telopea speciosissima]|uniref:uncharacterized protein LOC122650762 n=1 Tax=Telopea speciosissima TaxID=54955 RepID=UPI001CC443B7|nr:uncharacterized protein LOC122650762 [Telopea speciosissima]
MRFGKKGKLSPRYIGPYEILARVGQVAYRLALPPMLVGVHDVFHVFMLKKYVPDPSHVISQELPEVNEDLTYNKRPVAILDRKEYNLRNRSVLYVQVRWSNHADQEASWELESELRAKH